MQISVNWETKKKCFCEKIKMFYHFVNFVLCWYHINMQTLSAQLPLFCFAAMSPEKKQLSTCLQVNKVDFSRQLYRTGY